MGIMFTRIADIDIKKNHGQDESAKYLARPQSWHDRSCQIDRPTILFGHEIECSQLVRNQSKYNHNFSEYEIKRTHKNSNSIDCEDIIRIIEAIGKSTNQTT